MKNKDENQNFSYVGDSWNQSLNREVNYHINELKRSYGDLQVRHL